MRTLPFLSSFALGVLVLPSLAQDDYSDWYLEFGGGYAQPMDSDGVNGDIEFDDGYSLNLLIGREMGSVGGGDKTKWYLEIEGIYTDADIDDSGLLDAGGSTPEKLQNLAVLMNVVFERRLSNRLFLYAGGGAGWAPDVDWTNFNDGSSSFDLEDDNGFAYQGKAGLRCELGGGFSWSAGYRYYATEDLKVSDGDINSSFDLQNRINIVELAVRWSL